MQQLVLNRKQYLRMKYILRLVVFKLFPKAQLFLLICCVMFLASRSSFVRLACFKKLIAFALLIPLLISLFAFIHLNQINDASQPIAFRNSQIDLATPTESDYENGTKSFIVNTQHCKIPNFDPWSKSTQLLDKKCRKYFKGDPECKRHQPRSWSYVDGDHLVINMSALHESGTSWDTLRCCYRIIERVEQSLDKYDMNADKNIRYSSTCQLINSTRQWIDAEFIRLFCTSTSLPSFNDVVYRQFHAFAKFSNHAQEKVSSWNSTEEKPPNILLLGVDTNSRLNAHRNFKETLSLLKSWGAVEMMGYTKVGESTYPNTVAFMSGYTIADMKKFCYKTVKVAQDYCPYLWKAYDKAGYLTATVEDVPLGTSFNFLKAGFVHKPTDFFIRPMMLAVMKHLPREDNWYVRCLGSSMIENVMLNYIEDILTKASNRAPVFLHGWLAVLAHECSNSAKYGDKPISNFLRKIDKGNTIIMYMSDHGDIYGDFRETIQGWYEDKLPALWVYLPPNLIERFPTWYDSLKVNAKRLTSHFDMYKTLVHILKTFDVDNKAKETYRELPHQTGQSLFEPVPEDRTCSRAGVPEGYCACAEPTQISANNPKVQKATHAALMYITNMLPSQCETPVLKEIVKAKYFKTPKESEVYIISFIVEPGDFLFEGTVKQEPKSENFVVTNDVLRMNKIVRKVDCISIPLLERYCYCK